MRGCAKRLSDLSRAPASGPLPRAGEGAAAPKPWRRRADEGCAFDVLIGCDDAGGRWQATANPAPTHRLAHVSYPIKSATLALTMYYAASRSSFLTSFDNDSP